MATQDTNNKNYIETFWDNEYKTLNYVTEPFNDSASVAAWTAAGYPNRFTGEMCDMRSPQPKWNQRFVDLFAARGWQAIGTSYYRMLTGTVLPTHSDLYKKYVEIHQLQGQEHRIRRAIVFLEDWQPGHYAEYDGKPYVDWRAGAMVEWAYDMPHMAANVGLVPRYTLQITGYI
jgi:hypothetical protein